MKVVKPLSLGLLHKPYRYQQRHHFVVTALGFFRLGQPVTSFLREQDHWPAVIKALPADQPLDFAMPKGRGEVLLAAKAYAPNAQPVPEMMVRATVATIDKGLRVFGDREWLYGLMPLHRITPPQPFTVMPIGYDRAYGGPAYAENTLGQGHAARPLPALVGNNRGRMPNVEYPGVPVRSHRASYLPAGFGPTDIRAPSRRAQAGTYDKKWLQNDAPGLPEDVQWTLFNAAPPDQRIDGYFAGGEPYRLEGMHPQQSVIEGKLPAMRVRAFVQRKGTPVSAAEEIALVMETVWFFPDAELGVAMYRGQTGIDDSDALDVESVMIAYEHAHDPARPLAHYREVLQLRTDRAVAALHALNDAPLTPMVSAEERAAIDAQQRQAEADELARRQAVLDESTAEFWAQSNVAPPKDYQPPKVVPPPLPMLTPARIQRGDVDLSMVCAKAKELADHARQQGEAKLKALAQPPATPTKTLSVDAQRHAVEARASAVAHDLVGDTKTSASISLPLRGRVGVGFDATPQTHPHPIPPPEGEGTLRLASEGTTAIERVRHSLDKAIAAGAKVSAADQARALDGLAQLPALQRQGRRSSPTPLAPKQPLSLEAAAHLGRLVREWQRTGVCLAGRDLAGASLAGIDFAGADLREVMFECADLTGANFRGANLRGAVFTGAKVERADFTGADLTDANFCTADATAAVFREACLQGALAMEAQWRGADFTKANLRSIVATKASLTAAVFDDADLTLALLVEAVADGARFVRARFERTILLGAHLRAADFSDAQLNRTVLLKAHADGSRWCRARLTAVQTGSGASFVGADLREMRAEKCGWRGADLSGADFSGGRFMMCDFGLCRLDGAKLQNATWWRSIFMQAVLTNCDAQSADFFHAICRKADFRGTELRQAKLTRADFSEAVLGEAQAPA
ncbi:MAG: pentapeptide repeat-containing protein [Gammaproteobacteria bacterium]|nr:pentapeptide repeat-containing protein [Gammaproteobacteria bacterium]